MVECVLKTVDKLDEVRVHLADDPIAWWRRRCWREERTLCVPELERVLVRQSAPTRRHGCFALALFGLMDLGTLYSRTSILIERNSKCYKRSFYHNLASYDQVSVQIAFAWTRPIGA